MTNSIPARIFAFWRCSAASHPPDAPALAVLICALAAASACGGADPAPKRVSPVFDKETGQLQMLKFDSDGDGNVDTWSYMAGSRVLRIEIDRNQDGKVDRWEYYGADTSLEKVGSSRADNGKPDTWMFSDAGGAVIRMEIATRGDGKPNRVEHYEHGVLVSAEEDTDGDGKVDKWETYAGSRLASAAFDTSRRGTPDRRLVYGEDGSARVEVAANEDGRFVPAK
jgi:hypothetical protein